MSNSPGLNLSTEIRKRREDGEPGRDGDGWVGVDDDGGRTRDGWTGGVTKATHPTSGSHGSFVLRVCAGVSTMTDMNMWEEPSFCHKPRVPSHLNSQ